MQYRGGNAISETNKRKLAAAKAICDHVLIHVEAGNFCRKCGMSMSDVLSCTDLET